MGHVVEAEAKARGHKISHIIDLDNRDELDSLSPEETDVIIEFTHPGSFFQLMEKVLPFGIPVVSGTTGWYERLEIVRHLVEEHNSGFLYASNFSVGVNILFQMNKRLAEMMNAYPHYDCFIEEQHHNQKADAPSGTAHTLAHDLIQRLDHKERIATEGLINRKPEPEELSIGFIRSGDIVGKHKVVYTSSIDSISLEHQAYNRRGFALGAVLAAEWLVGKQGFYTFTELFK
jgi:4-hydroxy-tetrahydrodipicolinate reductase